MRGWVVPVALVWCAALAGGACGDLRLVDNGYEGLVVAITHHIPQEHCGHILHGLKNLLREVSSQMWSATEGRASLREVTVALPRSWRTDALTCSLHTPLMASSSPTEGHIRVTVPHPVFGIWPWTQQSQGCGRPGDFIQLSGDLLRETSNDSRVHAARLLVVEWAKFRWGVFDERGHSNDPLYPPTFRDPSTHRWTATGCANGEIKGRTCDYSQPGCTFLPDSYINTHLNSSLLAFPDLSNVRLFCDDKTHNRFTPTKHNSLCGGRSAWEIIQQTTDFAGGRNAAKKGSRAVDPIVRFVRQTSLRYVFVIEDTATMNLQRRWEFLRKAMRRVVVYDVPDRTYVGVVTFHSAAVTVAPLTFIEDEDSDMRQRVGSSLPRNPSPVPESYKCVICGLQEALRMIDTTDNSAGGASVILITSGSGPPPPQREVDEMMRLARQRHLRIEVVLYPLTERRGAASASHGLEALMEATRGSIFIVMDEGVGNDSKVKMMVALMDALLAAVQQSTPSSTPKAPVLVHSAAYPGGIASMSSGSFALDDSLGPNARFSIYYYDLNHVGNTIQLIAPSGQKIASVNVQEEDGDVNMIFISLEQAERGLWTFSVENRADSHQGLYVQVTAKQNSSSGLQVRLWTSSSSRPINTADPSTPVVIYADVKFGVAPVLNTRIVARLQRLGTNGTGSSYQPIFLDLWDNGIGDPDITRGDGVYSRYLPPLLGNPGRYLLSADVDNTGGLALLAQGLPRRHHKKPLSHLPHHHHHSYHAWSSEHTCCGSSLPHVLTRRAPPFLRHITWGVVEVASPPALRDSVPPSRILDLRVEVNHTAHEIRLLWTAPGDDWDVGRAHHYEAVVAPFWSEARAFQGDRLTNLPKPLVAGTLHTTNLHFIRYEELWYVSVRGVDEAGNVGGVGNMAPLWVPRPPSTYEITTRTHPALTTSGNYAMPSELGSGRPVGAMELRPGDVAVIMGSIGGFVLVVAVVVAYFYCHTTRRREEKELQKTQQGDTYSGSIIVKSSAEDARGSQESLNSVDERTPKCARDGSPRSPVQSSGATALLQGRDRRSSFPSEVTGDASVTQEAGGPPFPDVTVTNKQPTDGEDGGGVLQPPVFPPRQHEEIACHCPVPALDRNSCATAWDEPMTGHLLTRTTAVAPTPTTYQPQPHPPHTDRKRRNVTQV